MRESSEYFIVGVDNFVQILQEVLNRAAVLVFTECKRKILPIVSYLHHIVRLNVVVETITEDVLFAFGKLEEQIGSVGWVAICPFHCRILNNVLLVS